MPDSPRLARLYISLSKCARVYCSHPDGASLHGAGSFLRPLLVFFLSTGKREHSGAKRLVLYVQTGVAMVWHVRGAQGGAATIETLPRTSSVSRGGIDP
jgi:hypothetical protein